MATLHPTICAIRDRIEERSHATRSAYLARLAHRPTDRNQVGCANLAHVTAIYPAPTRKIIALHSAPHLAVVTAYNDMLSAHHPYGTWPQKIAQAAQQVGATTQVASGVPAMCDGITQGREGMELSLFSRDVIALSTAIGLSHDVFDGAILLGICDKITPGLLMGALGFGHLPSVFIPAGPMVSGLSSTEKAAVRQKAAQGLADRSTLLAAEEAAYHAPGTCTFYGTANSSQMMLDLMGLQFPGGAFVPPYSALRDALLTDSVHALTRATRTPHLGLGHLVDARCLVNAIVGLLVTGGSTNHTIHWLAVARAAGYEINWDDLNELSHHVPLITRIYPNGTADVNAFHAAGGTAAVIQWLIEAGLVDGDTPTAWGSTLGDTVAEPILDDAGSLKKQRPAQTSRDESVLRRPESPFESDGGLRLLNGNLGRAITKISAVKPEQRVVEAPCRVFSDQASVQAAFHAGELDRDVVVVVRHQGPRANGMPELHKLTPPLGVLQDKGFRVALVTDGRMSGASGKVLAAIHLSPEAALNGPIGQLMDGDVVRVDAVEGILSTSADLHARAQAPQPASNPSLGRGFFATFRNAVTTAEEGACTLFAQE
jgi:phosphogluconate dehydratase